MGIPIGRLTTWARPDCVNTERLTMNRKTFGESARMRDVMTVMNVLLSQTAGQPSVFSSLQVELVLVLNSAFRHLAPRRDCSLFQFRNKHHSLSRRGC